MEKYKIIEEIGDGSFGTVYKAISNDTTYAIKKMKKQYKSWNECLLLKELKALKKLNNHNNIIKLNEVLREKNCLYFVFEYANLNLYQLIKNRKGVQFGMSETRHYAMQILLGTSYMHKMGFFHRDLKPENLLLIGNCIKIADFGLAREIRSLPPYTDYVSTRWYRAPEILLRSTIYSSSVDMWAIGLIIAEIFNLEPLFAGQTEIDQLFLICRVLGSPANKSAAPNDGKYYGGGYWQDGVNLASKMGFEFSEGKREPVGGLIKGANVEAIELISQILTYDPRKRPSAAESLESSWFKKDTNFVEVINIDDMGSDVVNKAKEATPSNDKNFLDISKTNLFTSNFLEIPMEITGTVAQAKVKTKHKDYYSSSSDDEVQLNLLNSKNLEAYLNQSSKTEIQTFVDKEIHQQPQRQRFHEFIASNSTSASSSIASLHQQPSGTAIHYYDTQREPLVATQPSSSDSAHHTDSLQQQKASIWQKLVARKHYTHKNENFLVTPESKTENLVKTQNVNNRYSWFFSKLC